MTTAQQNPSRSLNSGSEGRRSVCSPSGRPAVSKNSTGQGVPGGRMGWAGAGDKLADTDNSLRRVNPVRGGTRPAS